MKKIFFAFSLLAGMVSTALAQKDSLQFDEANKYVYFRIVDKPGVSKDTLYKRALVFLKAMEAKTTDKTAANSIVVTGKFAVYGNALISKKEAGEITYQLNIDTKNGKYRYNFTGFIFTPFKIDRYGNMVALPGIYTPAEKLNAKYSRKDTDAYLDQIGLFCSNAARQLSNYLSKADTPAKSAPVKKVATDRW